MPPLEERFSLYEDFVIKFIKSSIAVDDEVYQVHVVKTPIAATGGVIQLVLYPKSAWQATIAYVNGKLSNLYSENANARANENDSDDNLNYSNTRSNISQDLQDIGLRLYNTLPFDARKALEAAFKVTQKKGKRLRIGIDLTEAPTLYALPWELLFHAERNQYFALSDYTPVVRMVATPVAVRPLPQLSRPLKVLIVLIATKPADVKFMPGELLNIKNAFASLEADKLATLDLLDGLVTFDRFRNQVVGNDYQLIHFIAHGGWDDSNNRATLQFHAQVSQTFSSKMEIQQAVMMPQHALSAEDLRLVLADNSHLRLIFLNSCEAGKVSAQEELVFADMSAGLVKNGIPAVIALQARASQEAAVLWSTELYNNLVRGKTLEEGLTESRKKVYLTSQYDRSCLGQWFVPVLYEATDLPEEIPPWYVQIENNLMLVLRRLGTERNFRGSLGLLALVIFGTLVTQFLIGRLIPDNPAWHELFLTRFNSLLNFEPANPIWLDYFLNVYLWLVGAAFILVSGATLWAYFDLQQEPVIGKLESGGRLYLLMLCFIGAILGLLTGLTLGFLGTGLILYYTGLYDLLPPAIQLLSRCLIGFVCVVTMTLFARRIPLSSRTASHLFKPVREEFIIAAGGFLVVAILFFCILFLAPAIFFNQPWGGVFIGFVLFLLFLRESYKAVRLLKRTGPGQKEEERPETAVKN